MNYILAIRRKFVVSGKKNKGLGEGFRRLVLSPRPSSWLPSAILLDDIEEELVDYDKVDDPEYISIFWSHVKLIEVWKST